MASEIPASTEPLNDQVQVNSDDGIAPQATSKIKWNVKGGGDRTEVRTIGHLYPLEGQPRIQGITITESPPVILYCWASTNGTGTPALTIPGPTSEVKNSEVRIGSFRLERR